MKYKLFVFTLLIFVVFSGYATTITVSSSSDSGAGTLRNAISVANNGDVIIFSSSLQGDSIVLTSGPIRIQKNITITGPGADKLIISGNGSSRIFQIDTGITVTIQKIQLRNGKAGSTSQVKDGGAILNYGNLLLQECVISYSYAKMFGGGIFNNGNLTINRCSIYENHADSSGGAIANFNGWVSITNSTISSNYAYKQGGGIFTKTIQTQPVPEVHLEFCTIARNKAGQEGGGMANVFKIYTDSTRVFLQSSIVALNIAGNYGVDILRGLSSRCSVRSHGFNLIGNFDSSGIIATTGDIMGRTGSEIDPVLEDLNLSATLPYHALGCGSPCLDSGDPFSSLNEDQLGQSRPFYGRNDIGAFESQVDLYIPLVYLGKDIDTCAGSQLSWDASSPGNTVNWFVNSSLKSSNSQTFTYYSGIMDTVVCEVISPAGCRGYDTVMVQLFDNIKPVFVSCPGDMIVPSFPDQCKAVASWTPPVATDNCSIDTIISNYKPGDTFETGSTWVIYKAYDLKGNFDSCAFKVTIKDTMKPIIRCSKNIVAVIDSGCTKQISYSYPLFSDNCKGATLQLVQGQDSGTYFSAGNHYIIFKAIDPYGNSDTCGFLIRVKDTMRPVLTGPSDTIVQNDPGDCGAVVNYSFPSVTDNCPGAQVKLVQGLPSGSFFPVGETLLKFAAVDEMNNTDTFSYTVRVQDNEPPVIQCPQDISSCETRVIFQTPQVKDNCSVISFEKIKGPDSGTDFTYGETEIVYAARDSAGNTDTCRFMVHVYHKPEIVLVSDTTIYYGDIFTLSPIVRFATEYEWTPDTWLDNPLAKNPQASPEQDILYVLTARNDAGCISIDSIFIHVIFEFIIPSAFTPDGDHVNDVWEIKGLKKFPDAELFIYDRWGRLLFHSTGYEEKWDGTYNGEALPIDSYYYILELHDGSKPYKGTVTIIR